MDRFKDDEFPYLKSHHSIAPDGYGASFSRVAQTAEYPSGFDSCKDFIVFLFYNSAFAKILHEGFIFFPVFTVEIQINGFFIPMGLHEVIEK